MDTQRRVRSLISNLIDDVDRITLNASSAEGMSSVCEASSAGESLSRLGKTLVSTLTAESVECVDMYTSSRLRNIHASMKAQQGLHNSREAIMEQLLDFIVLSYILSATRERHKGVRGLERPKNHHWVPYTYVRRFSSLGNPRSRRVDVARVSVSPDQSTVVRTQTLRKEFIHSSTGNKGYYSDVMETFFGRIESKYASAVDGLERGDCGELAYLGAFFIVQGARNPDPELSRQAGEPVFKFGRDADILNRILSLVESYADSTLQYVHGLEDMMFSVFFPPRVFVDAQGVQHSVFAISPTSALVISSAEITPERARTVAQDGNRRALALAKRTQMPLYGAASASE